MKSLSRFSLRTLLVALTVLGICLGIWVRRAERQRRSVAAIRSTFSEVFYDLNEAPNGTFDRAFQKSSFVPSWLLGRMGIDYFHPVVCVVFDSPQVTDATLVHVRDLPQLKRVGLIESATVTTRGLARLQESPGLEVLYLGLDTFDDVGFAIISALRNLKRLDIVGEHGSATDEGLQQLGRLNQLTWCWVEAPHITDTGRERLSRALPNCQGLK